MNLALELCMSVWVREKYLWDAMIAKRALAGQLLTPRQQERYDKWFNAPYRKLCFDKVAKTNIMAPNSLSAEAAKMCFMVEFKMSLDQGHLSMRFGSSPFFHLFVRRFTVSDSDAPQDVGVEHLPLGPAAGPLESYHEVAGSMADAGSDDDCLQEEFQEIMGENSDDAPFCLHEDGGGALEELEHLAGEEDDQAEMSDFEGEWSGAVDEADNDAWSMLHAGQNVQLRVTKNGLQARMEQIGGWGQLSCSNSQFSHLLPMRVGCRLQRWAPPGKPVRYQCWYPAADEHAQASTSITGHPKGMQIVTQWAREEHEKWCETQGAAASS